MELVGVSKVISAMPGAGKSTLMKQLSEARFKVSDSDSQRFSFLTNEKGQYIDRSGNPVTKKEERVANPNFIRDYSQNIQQAILENDLVFVSAHESVRDTLSEAGIEFDFVRFEQGMKQEVVNRIRNRKSEQPNEIIANIVES